MRTTIDLPDSLMKAAQEKAAVTGESLADLFERTIAREVGWRDPDFAARQFRRSVGVTPSKYRAISRRHAAQQMG